MSTDVQPPFLRKTILPNVRHALNCEDKASPFHEHEEVVRRLVQQQATRNLSFHVVGPTLEVSNVGQASNSYINVPSKMLDDRLLHETLDCSGYIVRIQQGVVVVKGTGKKPINLILVHNH